MTVGVALSSAEILRYVCNMLRLSPIATNAIFDSALYMTPPGANCDVARDVLSSAIVVESARDGIGVASTKSSAIVCNSLIKVTSHFSPGRLSWN